MKTDVIRMELAGASHSARIGAEDKLPGSANYFVGNDPSSWRTNVATFAKVRYSNVYPGVDLVYYGNQGQLEYDLVVAPNADVRPIRMRFAGTRRLRMNDDGSLTLAAEHGEISFHRPVVYQERSGQRENVPGKFHMIGKDTVEFRLGKYDRGRSLVIDPTVAYSTYLSGSEADSPSNLAVDSTGSVYIAGQTSSADFPTVNPIQRAPTNTDEVAFISKLSPDGSALEYSTFLGGNGADGPDGAVSIAIDSSDNAYVVGNAGSTNFPTTTGAFQTTANYVGLNAFVAKLTSTGNSLAYCTYLSGASFSGYGSVAVDSAGDAYITGGTLDSSFATTAGAFQRTGGGSHRTPFVTKLNPAGSGLVYSTFIGGNSNGVGTGIAVDTSGDAYITGSVDTSGAFPTTAGALQTSQGYAFVSKINPTGSGLVYSTLLGSDSTDQSSAVAIDSTGDAFITGSTDSSNFPVTQGAFQPTNKGAALSYANVFMSKINPSGTSLLYSTYLGGSNGDYANAIAVDSSGDAYVAGSTSSTDFPVLNPVQGSLVAGAAANAFLTELNAGGSGLLFSTYLGGKGSGALGDAASGVALDPAGNIYIGGLTASTNFPTTTGAFQRSLKGSFGVFVAKIGVSTNTSGTAGITFSANPLPFASQAVGSTSAPLGDMVTSSGTGPLTITNIAVSGNFALSSQPTSCPVGTAIAAGQTCAIWLTFTPTQSGSLMGTVTVYDNAPSSPQTFSLTGTGTGGTTSSIAIGSLAPAAVALTAGGTAQTITVGVSRTNFTGTVTLSTGTLPSGVTAAYTQPGTGTSGTVSLQASSTAPASSTQVMITASGSGVAPSTASFTVTVSAAAANQFGELVWVAGKSTLQNNQFAWPGVYGTQGVAASTNLPGAREQASTWTDAQASLWLFGGSGIDGKGNSGSLNDLWKFNSSTNQWIWISGSNVVCTSQPGVTCTGEGQAGYYGTKGSFGTSNTPGGRAGAASWIDSNGNLWLFGGTGYDERGFTGNLNDLWEFNTSLGEWAWIGGSELASASSAVYGAKGSSAAANTPGGRSQPVSWIDSINNLWLFGGYGADSKGDVGQLNDLWEFDTSSRQWTWKGGSNLYQQPGTYGTQSTWSATNIPGSRWAAVGANDSQGNFWLFGGHGIDSFGTNGYLNDLWEFSPTTDEWRWMGGSDLLPYGLGNGNLGAGGNPGVYGTIGNSASTNIPGGRSDAAGAMDPTGNFWLVGGLGYDSAGNGGYLNDIWEYDPVAGVWTWWAGSSTLPAAGGGQAGVYGTLGVPSASNIPGGREDAALWIDSNGRGSLFGGLGFDANMNKDSLNDFWQYYGPGAILPAAAPSISPAAGTYSSAQTVTISDATPGATIYYTTNGTTPTASSPVYSGPITVSASETIEAIAVASGYTNSAVASAAYTINVSGVAAATPTFSPGAGTYTAPQTVTISDATSGATIYYTTNGTTPTASSPVYSGPITVSASETIEALAVASGYANSAVASAAYIINLPTVATPTFSPGAGTYTSAQSVTIADATPGATIYYTTDGSTPTTTSSVYSGPITVSSSETINAIGVSAGYIGSTEASASYVIGTATVGIISTFAGNGVPAYSGDGGLAPSASLQSPADVALDSSGNVYIADGANNVIRKVTVAGIISTVAGNGNAGYLGDGGPATSAELNNPVAVALDSSGNLYIADYYNNRIRKVISTGTISTVAGDGNVINSGGSIGDGGAATSAALYYPSSVAVDGSGNLYIADTLHSRIRKVSNAGTISTVAGSQTIGYSGDGGLATSAALQSPIGVAVDSSGNLYISDSGNNVIRKVTAAGIISTLAGNGTGGYSGDGGAATSAELYNPQRLSIDGSGNLYVPDYSNNRLRKVTSAGTISTFAGNGNTSNNIGDGGPATSASLYGPAGVAVDGSGNVYIADLQHERVRKVTIETQTSAVATPTFNVAAGTYTSAQTVAISDATSGATIYYTTNGMTPTTSSSVYSGPITVSASETIEAIAVASGYTNSAVASAAYTVSLAAAATPTFSVAAGIYTSAQTVAISDATSGATIYYTTNGTTPTTSSTKYTGPITIASTQTVETIAVATGYANSAVASATYTINLSAAATPTFSPGAGAYNSAQTVTISDATGGATIYYTTNGTTPTASSSVYSGPIYVSTSETIEAITVASGYANSAVASAAYAISLPAATPTFSVAAGTYTSAQTVTLSDATSNATIYYTTNGTTPTTSSSVYSGPITVSASETIEAIAVASGYTNSAVASAAYTITVPTATISLSSSGNGSVTISSPGQSATSTITVTPSGGFTGTVGLTAAIVSSPSGAQDIPTLSFGTTSPLAITGSSAGTATLTISTTSPSAALAMPRRPQGNWQSILGPTLACFLLVCIRPYRRLRTKLVLVIAGAMFAVSLSSCGSGTKTSESTGNPGTTTGNYIVMVTASSGTTMAQTSISVTVN